MSKSAWQIEAEAKLNQVSDAAKEEFKQIERDSEFRAYLMNVGLPFSELQGRDYSSFNPFMAGRLTCQQNRHAEILAQQHAKLNRCTLPDSGGNSNYQFKVGNVYVVYFPYAGEIQCRIHESDHRPRA